MDGQESDVNHLKYLTVFHSVAEMQCFVCLSPYFEEYQIKHAVADPEAMDRTHPVFFSIPETFERWTTALEDLRPREAYVKRAGVPIKLRTLEVPRHKVTRGQLAEIIDYYRQRVLRPAPPLVDWEAGSTPQILSAGHARRIVLSMPDPGTARP